MREELIDRFGDIPKQTWNLVRVAYCKAMGEDMDIRRIRVMKGKLVLDYGGKNGVAPLVMYLTKGREQLDEVVELLELMHQKTTQKN